jgi:hypothetical protein
MPQEFESLIIFAGGKNVKSVHRRTTGEAE